eukprot:6968725-Alexandrium_andersonii.AAC.1
MEGQEAHAEAHPEGEPEQHEGGRVRDARQYVGGACRLFADPGGSRRVPTGQSSGGVAGAHRP